MAGLKSTSTFNPSKLITNYTIDYDHKSVILEMIDNTKFELFRKHSRKLTYNYFVNFVKFIESEKIIGKNCVKIVEIDREENSIILKEIIMYFDDNTNVEFVSINDSNVIVTKPAKHVHKT